MLFKCAQSNTELHNILSLLLQNIECNTIFRGETYIFGTVLKPAVCKAAADMIRIRFFPKILRSKKKGFVVTSFKIVSLARLQVISGRVWPAGRQFNHAGFDDTVR
jgi:hypothetical protein